MARYEKGQKKIIVLVGPSGSGKTTLGEGLTDLGYKKLVTTTTRKPRAGEVDGVDYYFRDRADLKADDFVEQTEYNQNIYGLTKAEINQSLEESDVVHVSLDRNGAEVIKAEWPDEAVVVFIMISQEEMVERMIKRGDSQEVIDERIAHCNRTGELNPPPFTDHVIHNHDMQEALNDLIAIIEAELFEQN